MIKRYVAKHPDRTKYFTSLGQKKYFSVLKNCMAVIGNSSSGLLEVPSFKIPTVNIGDRQKGRVSASSVINCKADQNDIIKAIKCAIDPDFQKILKSVKNPYYIRNTSQKIINILKKTKIPKDLKKNFYNIQLDNI